MKTFLVGGAVRDRLLGLPVSERDWVVVGADAAAMAARGFVAADPVFPVFHHPDSGEEYALARRETQRGRGYRGFDIDAGPGVTLEEDLRRRDLTINAMAEDADGRLIDPYGGRADLEQGLLRHVSPAFVEDPVRALRTARFAARLGVHGFRVAHGTHRLMCQMVDDGVLGHLKPERFWREMFRAMASPQPWRFFEVLHGCGALAVLIPPLAVAMGESRAHEGQPDSRPVAALKHMTAITGDPGERLAVALADCVDGAEQAAALARTLRADRATAQLLREVAASAPACRDPQAGEPGMAAVLDHAMRWLGPSSARAQALCRACGALAGDREVERLLAAALEAAGRVDVAALRDRGLSGAALGEALAHDRRQAMIRVAAAWQAGGQRSGG